MSAVFVAGRTIAGIGAAGLIQGALAIITYIAPLEQRPLYIGAIISVFGISACGGPILGGVLTDHVGWRWCFWMSVYTSDYVLLEEANLKAVIFLWEAQYSSLPSYLFLIS